MILLLDNYDSFVYNLARYVNELGFEQKVIRNNAIGIDEIQELKPTHIIISPGPCDPSKAGISLELVRRYGPNIPILGVCLGHQVIAQAYGGTIVRAQKPIHGKSSIINHFGDSLFHQVPSQFKAARYHSLIASWENLPANLIVIAQSVESEIMALRHRHFPVYGVQFHPESVLTEKGHQILQNFLQMN